MDAAANGFAEEEDDEQRPSSDWGSGSHNQVGDKLGSGFNGCSMPKQIAVTPGYGNLTPIARRSPRKLPIRVNQDWTGSHRELSRIKWKCQARCAWDTGGVFDNESIKNRGAFMP